MGVLPNVICFMYEPSFYVKTIAESWMNVLNISRSKVIFGKAWHIQMSEIR